MGMISIGFLLYSDTQGAQVSVDVNTILATAIDLETGEISSVAADISQSSFGYVASISEEYSNNALIFSSSGSHSDVIFPSIPDVPILSDVYIPLIPRDISRRITNLSNISVSLTVDGVSTTIIPTTGDVITSDSVLYLVRVDSSYLPDTSSSVGYLISATGIDTVSGQFTVTDALSKVSIVTSPKLGGVTVEFSNESGETYTAATDAFGEAKITLPNGDYTAVLKNPSYVFSTNNVPVSISGDQTLVLDASYTVESPQEFEGFCRIYFSLLKPDGTPMAGSKVIFTPLTTAGQALPIPLIVKTDVHGNGEVRLISGLTVKVAIEGIRMEETFVVPDSPSENLFNLISFSSNTPEVYIKDLPLGVRRTLNP